MSGQNLSLFKYFDFAISSGSIPSELQIQKIIQVSLLRLRLAAILDFNARKLRTKISIKERLFNGSIRYLSRDQDIEYRKRFELFGVVSACAWARWDLRRISSSLFASSSAHPHSGLAAWQPRVGFGLGLGGGGGGCSLLLLGGGLRTAGALLAQGGPLSYSFKTSAGSAPGLRAKAYFDLSVPLPLCFGDEAPDGGDQYEYGSDQNGSEHNNFRYSYNGNGNGSLVRLLLRKAAFVISV